LNSKFRIKFFAKNSPFPTFSVEDLLRWNDKDEYEMSIYDFMSGRPSPFAILLNDDNLLKVLNFSKTNPQYLLKKS